ncbi:MAG: CBS domain-containing protein, partial [Thermoleophilia bacterium]|nr:CBS domain-containing protein [Thermoleophilia bacterium]
MHVVSEILADKGSAVIEIGGDATVFEAVKAMVAANVGALLVTDGTEIAGIFTERDYLRRIAVEGRRSRDTVVRDVMSAPVIC